MKRLSLVSVALIALSVAPLHADQQSRLRPLDCCQASNVHTLGNVIFAGQPQPGGFEQARSMGVRTVVNLRKPGEMQFDQASVVRRLGMEYRSIPFNGGPELTDRVFGAVREVLRDHDRGYLLLHCASANRVGAVWLPYRVLDEGVSYEQALREAKMIGLQSEAYEAKARSYIQRARRS
jgi:protein tyrosine phosphatase (PTP) superfamily phosphohydrolase (DUF442 family)